MPDIRSRARAQLPSVLLTLLSIIQAVALERLWGVAVQRTELYEISWESGLAWLQTLNTFFVIVVIWLVYIGLVMRFRWTPSIGDLTYPFIVGVIELMLIETMGTGRLGAWFLVFAIVFATLQWLTHHLYRRARQDPENIEYFANMGRATWADQVKRASVSVIAVILAILLWDGEGMQWLAWIALTASMILTLANVWISARFWDTSMAAKD